MQELLKDRTFLMIVYRFAALKIELEY